MHVLFCLAIFTFLIAETICFYPILLNGKVNETLHLEVNKSVQYIIDYDTIQSKFPVRVFVQSDDATTSGPLIVVVRQRKEVLSWLLPLIVNDATGGHEFMDSARTLCPDDTGNNNKFAQLYADKMNEIESDIVLIEEPIVTISTSSNTNISTKVTLTTEDDFYLNPSTLYNITISPSKPKYFFYNFPNNSDQRDNYETVILELFSNSSICMTVSLQNSSCPVYDLNNDITFEGFFETVSRKGGITIPKSKFPQGFFVVFVAKGDDSDCIEDVNEHNKERVKFVTFSIEPSITYNDYVNAVFGTLGVIGLFYAIFGIGFYVCSRRSYVPRTMDHITDFEASTPSTVYEPDFMDNMSFDETEYDTVAETEYDREMILSKPVVYLSDLARKDPRILTKKSYSYLWHVLTVALFYLLPVIQLVITYQKVLNDTGNQDLCYYNFLCAHPLGFFSDFNHLFSNVGYVLFGFLFLWITYRRERWHQDPDFDRHYGIPQHFGLFYAIGVALIMEGVLSGSYHICPNQANFQFDTSFMYVTAVLCCVKLYQTRHPDINATAYATFGVLAVAILLGMFGILEANLYYWIGFTVVHVITCFYLTAQIYYMGCWKFDRDVIVRVFRACAVDFWSGPLNVLRPMYTSRMVLLIIGNVFNWTLAGFGMYYHEKDFALYLLGVFMLNTVYYFTFYIIMKLLHKERINKQTLFFLVLSLACAVTSMYCFLHKSVSWQLTPASSREYNQECKLMRFYDYHDIWHFLSAVGMFFMFMVLLTLDDDLSHVHRTKIHVF